MRVHIKTFGCSMNRADSETMAGVLKSKGHSLSDEAVADVIIVNTCTVKAASDRKAISYMRKQGKPLVVAGCLAEADPSYFAGRAVVGTRALGRIADAVEAVSVGLSLCFLEESCERLSLPVEPASSVSAIIPISQGCLGSCAYCRTRIARGRLVSFPSEAILNRCRQALDSGAKELLLTAEDAAAYGKDSGESLFTLVESISALQGDFRIRLGMANPRHVIENLDRVIDVYKRQKLYSFLHIPVQSGSDRVLRAMLRQYSRRDFLEIVGRIRASIPDMTICTDIICGFPGETEADFQETLSLIKEASPDLLHISGYSKRPGTRAASLRAPDSKTIRQRTREAAGVFSCMAEKRNQRWHGWKGPVMCVSYGKDDTTIARNFAYRQVILPHRIQPGQVRQAEIMSSKAHYLVARIC